VSASTGKSQLFSGDDLATFRLQNRLTQEKLAAQLGLSRNYIYLIESKRKPMTGKLKARLALLTAQLSSEQLSGPSAVRQTAPPCGAPECYALAEISGLDREDLEELSVLAPDGYTVTPVLIHPMGAACEPVLLGTISGTLANLAAPAVKRLAAWLFQTLRKWAEDRDPGHGAGIGVNGHQFSALNPEQLRRALQQRADNIQRRHAAHPGDQYPGDIPQHLHAPTVPPLSTHELAASISALDAECKAMSSKLDTLCALLGGVLHSGLDAQRKAG
jgi:transcriptional regulator with XRE-family HTH domain